MASLTRLPVLIALIAGLMAAGAGAVWFRASLDAAFARGRDQGRLETDRLARQQHERLRAASLAALEQSNRDAAQLALRQGELQDQVHVLSRAIAKSAVVDGVCLDADVVRALAAIGARGVSPGPGP